MDDKRIIDGYEEKFNFQLDGRLVILAENAGADKPFLVCLARWDNPLGAEVYYDASVTSDYLEAVRKFIRQETVLLDALDLRRDLSGLPFQALTAADCVPGGMESDMKGKLVVVKPEVLSPEARSAEYQLGICRGGFGSRPGSFGTAVFIDSLLDGETRRYERYEIAGVVDPERLPEWAKAKMRELAPVCYNDQQSNVADGEMGGQPANGKQMEPSVKSKLSEVEKNAACAASIDRAIQASYLGNNHYDLKAAVSSVMGEHGAGRVAAVLAANLSEADYDGRFSAQNKAWAKDFREDLHGDATSGIVLNTHRAVLDGFVTRFRETRGALADKKPSIHSVIDNAKQEAAAQNAERPKGRAKGQGIEK